MSEAMIEQKQKERKFLEQLLNNTKLDSYDIPVPIKAELRKYQQVKYWNHFILISLSCRISMFDLGRNVSRPSKDSLCDNFMLYNDNGNFYLT